MTRDQFKREMAELGLTNDQADFLLDMHEVRLHHGLPSALDVLAGLIGLLMAGGNDRIEDTINRGILKGEILP